jgi:hypothetical protein
MKPAKKFLQQIDTFMFESVAKQLSDKLSASATKEQIEEAVQSVDVVAFKMQELVEYLDKNKDKLLSLATYTEGDPVVVGDEYAPHAKKHGKVVSVGAATGTVKVAFEDGEYDVPEHHLTRKDAIANESMDLSKEITNKKHEKSTEKDAIHSKLTEQSCLALLDDSSMYSIVTENVTIAREQLEEKYGMEVLAIFPEKLNESALDLSSINESEMTQAQKDKREKIVMGLKKNKTDLKKRYGDRWESVMYAIATKQAMEEAVEEALGDIIFKQKTADGMVKIIKDGEYFALERLDKEGNVVDKQEFDNVTEAEKAAQNYM